MYINDPGINGRRMLERTLRTITMTLIGVGTVAGFGGLDVVNTTSILSSCSLPSLVALI